MKNLKLIIPMAVTALLSLVASNVQAQFTLNCSLTARWQVLADHQVKSNSPVFIWTTKTIKVTNKDLLKLLELAYRTNSGAFTTVSNHFTLGLSSGGDFDIFNKAGAVVKDATTDGFFSNFTDGDSSNLANEVSNDQTGAESFTSYFTGTFSFTDSFNGNSFTFGGMEVRHYNRAANGKFTDSRALVGSGTGDIETAPSGGGSPGLIILTGSVSANERGTALLLSAPGK